MSIFSRLTLITGPSGVGKGSLVKKLLERNKELWLSVSATTRKPRKGEINGEHYFFLDRKLFQKLKSQEGFLESAEFAGNLYGTPIAQVKEKLKDGKKVLLEIELEGARQVKISCPEVFRVFIAPPSINELEKRIRGRGSENESEILKRLKIASEELKAKKEFDAVVINEDLNLAVLELESLIKSRY